MEVTIIDLGYNIVCIEKDREKYYLTSHKSRENKNVHLPGWLKTTVGGNLYQNINNELFHTSSVKLNTLGLKIQDPEKCTIPRYLIFAPSKLSGLKFVISYSGLEDGHHTVLFYVYKESKISCQGKAYFYDYVPIFLFTDIVRVYRSDDNSFYIELYMHNTTKKFRIGNTKFHTPSAKSIFKYEVRLKQPSQFQESRRGCLQISNDQLVQIMLHEGKGIYQFGVQCQSIAHGTIKIEYYSDSLDNILNHKISDGDYTVFCVHERAFEKLLRLSNVFEWPAHLAEIEHALALIRSNINYNGNAFDTSNLEIPEIIRKLQSKS